MKASGSSYLLTDLIGGRTSRPDHTLIVLADGVRRLAPSPRNPDRFHEDKSEIVYEFEQLVREVRR